MSKYIKTQISHFLDDLKFAFENSILFSIEIGNGYVRMHLRLEKLPF